MNEVLVVIDMQNDFITGALGSKEAQAIVPVVAEKIASARGEGTPICYTMDTHTEEYLQTQEGRRLPVSHCIRGTEGWQIAAALAPEVGDAVFEKPVFGSVKLGQAMAALNEKAPVEKITLVGVCTDICVIANAMLLRSFLPECEIAVDAACCAGVTPASHATALAAMRACQVQVQNDEGAAAV